MVCPQEGNLTALVTTIVTMAWYGDLTLSCYGMPGCVQIPTKNQMVNYWYKGRWHWYFSSYVYHPSTDISSSGCINLPVAPGVVSFVSLIADPYVVLVVEAIGWA